MAVENYKKAIKLNKENPYLHYNLACAYIKSGDIKKAKSAIWWQKDHTMLWVILGLVGMMFLCFVPLAIFGDGDGETSSESDNVEVIESVNGANEGTVFSDLSSTMTGLGERLT